MGAPLYVQIFKHHRIYSGWYRDVTSLKDFGRMKIKKKDREG
jgi:hypothetical protein